MLRYTLLLSILCSGLDCFGFNNFSKDSLLTLISASNSSAAKIDWIIDVSVIHSDNLELDSATYYATMALSEAKSTFLVEEQGESYYALGYAYDMVGKLKEAFKYYELARLSFEPLNKPLLVAKAMNAKGAAAYYAGDFDLAIKYYMVALEYDEEHNLLEEQGDVLNNIALVYGDYGKYVESLKMFKRTLIINKTVRDTHGVAQAYSAIGSGYYLLDDFENSIKYIDSSINLFGLLKDTVLQARSYGFKGKSYIKLKNDFVNARANCLKAVELFKTNPYQTMQFDNLLVLGEIELAAENNIVAKNYFQEARDLIDGTERNDKKLQVSKHLKHTYNILGDYKQAYAVSEEYDQLFKKVQDIEKQKFVEDLQTKYDTDQKEKQIQIQELELSQTSNEKKIFMMLSFLFAIALLSSIAFVVQKIRTNKKLAAQQTIIEKALLEKDVLLREIHHRVKNNLQVISSLLSLQGRYTNDPNIEAAIREGKDRVKSMSLIHQNLYQRDNLTGVDVQDYFSKLFKSLFTSYNIRPDKIKLSLNIETLNLELDSIVPIGLVVNELVSNSLKHAFPDDRSGTITVSLKEQNETIVLVVQDDGIGFDIDNLNDSESIGYTLIDTFKNKLNADVEINGERGTKITLQIKKYNKVA